MLTPDEREMLQETIAGIKLRCRHSLLLQIQQRIDGAGADLLSGIHG